MKEKSTAVRYGYFILAAAIYGILVYAPLEGGALAAGQACLTETGRKALGVLAFCLVLWITEPVPFHITGFIGVLLMFVLKIEAFSDLIKQGFGNETTVFFVGVLTLSAMVTKTGLG